MISHTIHIHEVSKKQHQFMVKVEQVEQMLAILRSFAPRAAIGFTDEVRKKYEQDPWSVMSGS